MSFFKISDQLDYYENLDRLEDFKQGLSKMSTIQVGSVDFWLTGYTTWLNSTQDKNITVFLNEGKLTLCVFDDFAFFVFSLEFSFIVFKILFFQRFGGPDLVLIYLPFICRHKNVF